MRCDLLAVLHNSCKIQLLFTKLTVGLPIFITNWNLWLNVISVVFRNLKKGVHFKGSLCFQKCPKFSILFHINFLYKIFTSKGGGAGAMAP